VFDTAVYKPFIQYSGGNSFFIFVSDMKEYSQFPQKDHRHVQQLPRLQDSPECP
jgi:hypothetical protein